MGHIPGIVCYEIEKFLPSPVEPILNGKFHEGDCYIILKTYIDELNSLNWQIYFWIGSQSTVSLALFCAKKNEKKIELKKINQKNRNIQSNEFKPKVI